MPKYHLHFATDKEDDMRSMLQLALATDMTGKTAAIICPKAKTYTLEQHKYLRQNFVTVYVTEDNRVVDTHKHFIEAAGHSEHGWFIQRLQTPGKLEPIAKGPKNSMPSARKQKAQPKVPVELLARLQAPSKRGLAEEASAIVLPDGEACVSVSASVVAGQTSPTSFPALIPEDGYCKARLWADGLLSQCTSKAANDFCLRHAPKQSHGRIDEMAPADVAVKAQKHLMKKSKGELLSSQNSEQSQAKRRKESDGGVV